MKENEAKKQKGQKGTSAKKHACDHRPTSFPGSSLYSSTTKEEKERERGYEIDHTIHTRDVTK